MYKNKHGIELEHVAQTVQTKTRHRKEWLVELVKKHGWTWGAELGIWKGNTMFHLLVKCPELHMIGVDLWAAQPDNPGQQNYCEPFWKFDLRLMQVIKRSIRFNGRARIIKDYTVKAAEQVYDGTLDFVFIDADHSAVAADIEAWRPKLKPQGKLIGHDINWVSVKKDVDRLVTNYEVGPDTCWISQ